MCCLLLPVSKAWGARTFVKNQKGRASYTSLWLSDLKPSDPKFLAANAIFIAKIHSEITVPPTLLGRCYGR